MSAGWLGAVLAAVPIALVLGMMGFFRVKGHISVLSGMLIAALLALLVWQKPVTFLLTAGSAGVWKGLFPVVYIVAAALVLYNLTVVTGYATQLRAAIESITRERSLHMLLIGYGFAAFLDATAGFLTPIVVGTSMLISLGFTPMFAARYTLVASATPAIFGAMGIPVFVLADVTGIPVRELSPALSVGAGVTMGLLPVLLVGTFNGWAELKRLWIPVVATGVGYAGLLMLVASFVDYQLAAVAAALGAMVGLGLGARLVETSHSSSTSLLSRSFLRPWTPYFILMGMLLIWSIPVVKQSLGTYGGSAGTAILMAAALFGLWARTSREGWQKVLTDSRKSLKISALAICAVFAMAEIMKTSGMTAALGAQVGKTGSLFPFFSPFIQWVAAASTGSNTTSIAVVGGLQATTARTLGMNPLTVTVLAGVAAAVGKMAAPQVLTAGAVAAGLQGEEGNLLKVGIRYSLAITLALGVVCWILA